MESDLKITVTQDELTKLLRHATTNKDITELKEKLEKLEAKIEKVNNRFDKLYERIFWFIFIIAIFTQFVLAFKK